MFDYLIVLFAFSLGFVLVRASTCTVAATKRIVNRGKPDWLIGIMIAAGWSGITLVILRWALGDQFAGPLTASVDGLMIVAAMMMGIGAYLNNGCFIGTVARISGGDTSYIFTFAGLFAARALGDQSFFDQFPNRQSDLGVIVTPNLGHWLLFLTAVGLGLYGLYLSIWKRQAAIVALSLMGVFAALTFTSDPYWSYEAVAGNLVTGKGFSPNLLLELSALGLFTGALISSIQQESFEWKAPKFTRIILCFAGGVLMGMGAKFVPGGNDTLILWVIPNLALHGAIAFAIMLATVAVLETVKNLITRDQA